MMLGEMHFADEVGKGGLYRADQPTLYLANPDQLPQLLTAAITQLPASIYESNGNQPAITGQKNQSERFTEWVTIKGKRYSQSLIIDQYERVKKAFTDLRQAEQTAAQPGRGEATTDELRLVLNQAYSLFTRYFGTLTRNRAVAFLEEYDPQFATVQALEVVSREEKGELIRRLPKPIFSGSAYTPLPSPLNGSRHWPMRCGYRLP